MHTLKIPRTLLAPEILSCFKRLDEFVGEVCLVGGNTRDYFLSGKLGSDYDLEIRPRDEFKEIKESDWTKLVLDLFPGKKYRLLPMRVIRIAMENGEIELSLPRQDNYAPGLIAYGHSDFTPKFSHDLSYKESFARRDFTCNAIGLVYESKQQDTADSVTFRVIDPFGGVDDLKAMRLRPVTADFIKDPVRWLRLIRFAWRHRFNFNESDFPMSEGNLSALSNYYLLKECLGNNFFHSLKILTGWIEKYSWPVPAWLPQYYFLGGLSMAENFFKLEDQEELLVLLLCGYSKIMSPQDYMSLGTVLQTKKLVMSTLVNLASELATKKVEDIQLSGRQKEQLRNLRPVFEKIANKAKHPAQSDILSVAKTLAAKLA
jgi:tRNA nucleotidyltransferase (CCA-adding enzyme)